jgi:subtilisin family serine protease
MRKNAFFTICFQLSKLIWNSSNKSLIFLFLATSFTSYAVAQAQKIDPVFRAMIIQKNLPSSARTSPTPFKIEPIEGYAYKGAPLERRYHCFVYTNNGKALRDSGMVVNSVLPKLATVWATLEQIEQMSRYAMVQYIEAPQADELHNDISVAASGASLLHNARLNNTVYKGKGVIVAVYDSGIDWDHADFRNPADPTKSRILRIWDQTITAGAGETPPAGFSYGVEYTQAHINDELDGSPANYVREKDIHGHGTHVAGTAAGNGSALPSRKYTGMAPEADLIIIKGGNGSFPQSNTVDAITYLKGLANTLGRPIVLNMSIGGQTGPHDGTLPHELAVDDFTSSGPGRVVVISAGNDNGANIHNQFNLTPSGGSNTISFTVPTGTTGTDVFQYTAYAFDNSDVTAVVTTPAGETVTATAGQFSNPLVMTSNFRVNLNNSIGASNGHRTINLYITRNGANTADPTGTWTLTIINNSTNAVAMHGWLNYRNSAFSSTALVGGDSNFLIGSPGNATTAITTASYVGKLAWWSSASGGGFNYTGTTQQDNISPFSAIGPRRDGLLKPEIAAHGQAVISCLSSDITPIASEVVETGLYHKNQGTSMAAPGVTGAIALLLQAKPSATASEIKTLLTSNANTDALTGTVPNNIWGYGKLDVFKTAASIFNCMPAARITYQYDNSFTSAQNLGVLLGTQRIAVRFTPTITGRFGGFSFHTAATASLSDLVAEIRTNNAGSPGTLLGALNIPATSISKFSWNYVDASALNIPVTNGTDYFVVLFRDPLSTTNWSLTRENVSLDNRSLLSSNGGATWGTQTFDYRIRSVVYDNGQLLGTLAGNNSSDTRNINTSNQLLTNCNLIAQLVPNGATPVEGTVTGKVWIESSIPYYANQPYVARHYEITPVTNASIATGRVTLYFSQAEFDAFNNDPGSAANLPANDADAVGKANLKVVKFPGNSGNGTGLPASYSGQTSVIDPDDNDIIWNADQNRWEVSFNVEGFSGFIVQTTVSTLPVRLEYFTGIKQGTTNLLNWKADCSNLSEAAFEIQRSSDGANFNSIGNRVTRLQDCSLATSFIDVSPLPGKNFYRLKIVENRSITRYTHTILLQGNQSDITLYPTLLQKGGTVQVNFIGEKGNLVIVDALGKRVLTRTIRNGIQSLSLNLQVSGTYYYSVRNDKGQQLASGKLVVE